MTEGLFILTTIFVAYVVYQIVGDQNAATKSKAVTKPVAKEQPKPEVVVTEEKHATTKPAPVKATPIEAESPSKPAETKSTAAKPSPAKKTTAAVAQSTGLKNPKTGEVATLYSNYRFTKRWIKEALVAEGLLDKVYSNNELNAEVDTKIKAALAQLETMDKYKA